MFSILSYVLCLAVVLSTVFFPKEKESEVQPTIVRVWNVDTFEGGKGSRTAFLKKCAKIAQGKTSCRYLVTSYTKEGAIDAKQRGEIPDILSFGIGLDVFLENTLALNGTFIGDKSTVKRTPFLGVGVVIICFRSPILKGKGSVRYRAAGTI